VQEFSGPLAQPVAETVARFKAAPGVSGIFLVVFTDDFKKITVANTVPAQLQVKTLRATLEALEPSQRRILVPG
jgi:hypothetical protein